MATIIMPPSGITSRLEKHSQIWGIIAAIVSIVVAIPTTYFAIQTYRNTEQIDELKNITKEQQKQLTKLGEISDKLAFQIAEQVKLNKENHIQTSDIKSILHASLEGQARIDHFDSKRLKSDFEYFIIAMDELQTTIPAIPGGHTKIPIKEMLDYISEIQAILMREKNNMYLVENDTLRSLWNGLLQNAGKTKRIINYFTPATEDFEALLAANQFYDPFIESVRYLYNACTKHLQQTRVIDFYDKLAKPGNRWMKDSVNRFIIRLIKKK